MVMKNKSLCRGPHWIHQPILPHSGWQRYLWQVGFVRFVNCNSPIELVFFRLFKLAVNFSHSPGSRKTSGWQLKLRLGWLGAPWAYSQVQQSKMATWVLLNGRVGLTQTPAKVSYLGTFTFLLVPPFSWRKIVIFPFLPLRKEKTLYFSLLRKSLPHLLSFCICNMYICVDMFDKTN